MEQVCELLVSPGCLFSRTNPANADHLLITCIRPQTIVAPFLRLSGRWPGKSSGFLDFRAVSCTRSALISLEPVAGGVPWHSYRGAASWIAGAGLAQHQVNLGWETFSGELWVGRRSDRLLLQVARVCWSDLHELGGLGLDLLGGRGSPSEGST